MITATTTTRDESTTITCLDRILNSTLAEHREWSEDDRDSVLTLIKREGREELLDCDIVVIPPLHCNDSSVLWFDDSYDTMIRQDGGVEWQSFAEATTDWQEHAQACVQAAGYDVG